MKFSCSITILTKRRTEMTTWRDYSDVLTFSEALDKSLDSLFKDEKMMKVKVEKSTRTYFNV